MQHTELCKQKTEESNKRIEEWKCRWPYHCKVCLGAGQFVTLFDPSPPGISLGSGYMEDVELCSCTSAGVCPRCGYLNWQAFDEDEIPETPCNNCGWNWGKLVDDDSMPYSYECFCYEDEPSYSEYMQMLES